MTVELLSTSPTSGEVLNQPPTTIEQAFATDNFEQGVRDKQRQIFEGITDEERYGPINSKAVEAYDNARQIILDYLDSAGITPDQPGFGNYYNVASRYSYTSMDDTAWKVGRQFDNNAPDKFPVPGRTRLQMEHEALFGYQISMDGSNRLPAYRAPVKAEEEQKERSLEDIQNELDIASKEVSAAYADRAKVGFTKRDKRVELQDILDQKTTQLKQLTTERNNRLVAQLRAENMSDEQIVEKLAEQNNGEIHDQDHNQREAMIGDKWYQRKWNRINERYANATTPTKIAAGVVGGLVVTSVAAFAVTTGSAAAVTTVLAVTGTRVLRTYYLNKSKLYETPTNPKPIEAKVDDTTYKTVDEVLAEANSYQSNIINERIENADKINRRAFLAGLGAAALGGVGVAMEHSDTVQQLAGRAKDGVGNMWNSWVGGDKVSAMPEIVKTEPIGPAPGDIQTDVVPPRPVVEAPGPSFDASHFADASRIDSGEGWLQTFGEAGVTNLREQEALLGNHTLMNQLKDMNLAYYDKRIGGWGIYQTPDGKMPPEALRLIRDHAWQNRYTLAR